VVRDSLAAVAAMTAVLGLDDAALPEAAGADAATERALDALIGDRLAARTDARSAKDWARADAIREALAAAGIVIEDSADGARWYLAED